MSRPNILVIVLDTARADIAGDPDVMPMLHQLVTDTSQFIHCFANAPWTLPSHSSIFTGKLPTDHRVVGKGDRFNSDIDLASILSHHGYATAAFSNNPWISPNFGFDSFDEFVACWKRFQRGSDLAGVSQHEGTRAQLKAIATELFNPEAPFTLANAFYMRFLRGRYDSGARLTTRRLMQWLDDHDEEPFFAFVNYMEPHLEYDPPKAYAEQYLPSGVGRAEAGQVNQDPWAYLVGEEPMDDTDFETLRALYRAELAYLDDRLAELIDHLEQTGRLDDTALFVLGDHGENIGEHGLMDHQYSLHDTLLHVPLVARYPPAFEPGTTCDELVELRDLFPTILQLADIPLPDDDTIASTSLQSALNATGRDHAIAEYPVPQPAIGVLRERYEQVTTDLSRFDRRLRSVRTTDWHYIQSSDGEHELYNLTETGREQVPVEAAPDVHRELKQLLVDALGEFSATATSSDREFPDENREHLEDLGYL